MYTAETDGVMKFAKLGASVLSNQPRPAFLEEPEEEEVMTFGELEAGAEVDLGEAEMDLGEAEADAELGLGLFTVEEVSATWGALHRALAGDRLTAG